MVEFLVVTKGKRMFYQVQELDRILRSELDRTESGTTFYVRDLEVRQGVTRWF